MEQTKKKNILLIFLTILSVFIIFIVSSYADTFYNKPIQKKKYITLRIEYDKDYEYKTIKELKDEMLLMQTNKKYYNPNLIIYKNIKNLYFPSGTEIFELPYNTEKPFDIIKSKTNFEIYGECNEFYQIYYNKNLCYVKKTFAYKEKEIVKNNNIIDKTEINNSNEKSFDIKENKYAYAVQKDGNVDDTYISSANIYWQMIPFNVRKYFIDNGWEIYVTDKNISDTFFNGQYRSVAGVTVFSQKKIYIEDRQRAIKIALIHEVGHFIDHVTGTLSLKEDFYNIYKQEVSSFNKNISASYNVYNSQEYFAEIYSQSILYPQKCMEHVPLSYGFVMAIEKNI